MSEMNEIFADGVGEITLSGGMVRMDLFSIVGKGEDDNQPQIRVHHRVILPPEGFLRSFSAMEDLVKKLVEAGIIRKRDGAAGGGVEPVNSEQNDPAKRPKSPNF